MNSYTHSQCPLCHFSYPTSALPTHLAAHRHAAERAAALGIELEKMQTQPPLFAGVTP